MFSRRFVRGQAAVNPYFRYTAGFRNGPFSRSTAIRASTYATVSDRGGKKVVKKVGIFEEMGIWGETTAPSAPRQRLRRTIPRPVFLTRSFMASGRLRKMSRRRLERASIFSRM